MTRRCLHRDRDRRRCRSASDAPSTLKTTRRGTFARARAAVVVVVVRAAACAPRSVAAVAPPPHADTRPPPLSARITVRAAPPPLPRDPTGLDRSIMYGARERK